MHNFSQILNMNTTLHIRCTFYWMCCWCTHFQHKPTHMYCTKKRTWSSSIFINFNFANASKNVQLVYVCNRNEMELHPHSYSDSDSDLKQKQNQAIQFIIHVDLYFLVLVLYFMAFFIGFSRKILKWTLFLLHMSVWYTVWMCFKFIFGHFIYYQKMIIFCFENAKHMFIEIMHRCIEHLNVIEKVCGLKNRAAFRTVIQMYIWDTLLTQSSQFV